MGKKSATSGRVSAFSFELLRKGRQKCLSFLMPVFPTAENIGKEYETILMPQDVGSWENVPGNTNCMTL